MSARIALTINDMAADGIGKMLGISSALVGVVALLLAGAAHAQTPPPASPSATPPTAAKLAAIDGSLPIGLREGESFEVALKVSGGTPPFTWSIVAGSLPDGVVLHSKAGFLHGTPEKRGEFRFTVQARDANNATITRAFEFSILFNPSFAR